MKKKEKGILFGTLAVTFMALIWLIIRSGTRIDRLRYPCQRTSLNIVIVGMPLIGSLIGESKVLSYLKRKKIRFLLLTVAVVLAGGLIFFYLPFPDFISSILSSETIYAENNQNLKLTPLYSASPVSRIYIAQGKNTTHSLNLLLSFMNEKGLSLYETSSKNGIISKDDTVLIKVNGEWEERGGTNTDLLKTFIQKILEHPEGFIGEVVVVENGQWAIHLDSPRSNAEDITQSFRKVVDYFQNQGYKVSLYDWTQIGGIAGNIVVIDENEREKDGYVDMPQGVSYPIFTTKFGTRISLKDGIWKDGRYDKSKLKFINMPVLKSHSLMGVTAAVKHYMGVLSTSLCNDGFDQHEGIVYEGLLGKLMTQVIYPDLNILDANYIGVSSRGPASSYESAYRANIVLASKNPIALDYYAGKYILYPLTRFERHNPDNKDTSRYGRYPYNSFRQYLRASLEELKKAGYQVTMDEKEIQTYVLQPKM